MRSRSLTLVDQDEEHLHIRPELREGVMELQRLGAISKFRGAFPGTSRVRGLPRNPSDQQFTLGKLRPYLATGGCLYAPNPQYMRSRSISAHLRLQCRGRYRIGRSRAIKDPYGIVAASAQISPRVIFGHWPRRASLIWQHVFVNYVVLSPECESSELNAT